MKNSSLKMMIAAAMLLSVGCGKYEKNPVEDLKTLRANGKAEIEKGADQPQVITKEVVVTKEVEVVKEQATVDASYLVISADNKMVFKEGALSQYKIKVRSLVPGVGAKLSLQSELPVGASFQAAANEPGTYVLSWKPSYEAVQSEDGIDALELNVVAQFTGLTNENKDKLGALSLRESILFFVTSAVEKAAEGAK